MLQTSLLLMRNLNKTETPIFLSVVCFLFPKAIFVTFILHEPISRLNSYKNSAVYVSDCRLLFFAGYRN